MASGWHRRRTDTPAYAARRRKHNSPEHRAARKAIQAKLDRGEPVRCWRCSGPIANVSRSWHVGHDDIQVDLIRGPECASCNLRAAARKGARIANARRRTPRPLRRVVRRNLL